jgi:hypothetical protein
MQKLKTQFNDLVVSPAVQNGEIITQGGKSYKVVAGVMRNTGSGWALINDGSHPALNVASITDNSTSITINFSFTSKGVVSFVATPDETMALDNVFMGASVGFSSATLQLSSAKEIGGYIAWNGSAWTTLGATGLTSFAFSGGILTITHEAVINTDSIYASVNTRNGENVSSIGSVGNTTTQVYFRDYAGALITTENTDMRIYFSRSSGGRLNPENYTKAGSNIWFYGMFEV